MQYTGWRRRQIEQRRNFQESSTKGACKPRWSRVRDNSIESLNLFNLKFFFTDCYSSLVLFQYFRELSKDTTILLQFKNKELETSYTKQRESMSSVPLIASVLVHIVASVYSSLILPSSPIHFLVIIAPIILTLPIVWISVAESFPIVCYRSDFISFTTFGSLHF